ncbi:hypothetical protein KKC83_03560 [Patescibacteria group bacterium]|nr:hypothetical protein [Candidatus Falkowbacteria bacterium]MBU3905484.1 hypothetical protein [Patescibacteria group bacterium]MBU4015125.1 hypothetical protein [Patescibacteria group bacterium]MBU4026591.1 hypothetical protein [Patescibacteria group bacterium]MBU4073490.1 hypothetical protein [Patescibacteria group bacterium]
MPVRTGILLFENKITKGGETLKNRGKGIVKKQKTEKRKGKIMKEKLFTFVVFIVMALFGALPIYACDDCETIMTVGEACLDADQYQSHLYEELGTNHTTMYGSGTQSIVGSGLGDSVTFVEVEAELLQYEPYSQTETLPLGQITYEGESQMHIYGMANTDELCQELSMNIQNDRNFSMENSMNAEEMDSNMHLDASLSMDVTGATGTTGAAGLNEQIHSYVFERDDGAWQQGIARTKIYSGAFPE